MSYLRNYSTAKNKHILKRRLSIFVKIAITIVFLIFLVSFMGGIKQVILIIKSIDLSYFIIGVLICIFDRILMTLKWLFLLGDQRELLPFWKGFKIYCASMVWGLFLPVTIGADVVRVYSTSRLGLESGQVFVSIIIERMIGFFSALILGLLSLFLLLKICDLNIEIRTLLWTVIAMLGTLTAVFTLFFSDRAYNYIYNNLLLRFRNVTIIQKIKKMHSLILNCIRERNILLKFFLLTICEQLLPSILLTWIIAKGLNIDLDLIFIMASVPLSFLVSRLPISIDGIGVYESIFVLITSLSGLTASEAVAISFTGRIILIVSLLPWWLIYFIENKQIRPPKVFADNILKLVKQR